MNPIIKLIGFVLLIGMMFHLPCKKETSCEGCATKNNKLPIAVEEPDQVITLSTDSLILDGRSSSDSDGMKQLSMDKNFRSCFFLILLNL